MFLKYFANLVTFCWMFLPQLPFSLQIWKQKIFSGLWIENTAYEKITLSPISQIVPEQLGTFDHSIALVEEHFFLNKMHSIFFQIVDSMSWHDIRHCLFFSSEGNWFGSYSAFPKNCCHVFVGWQIQLDLHQRQFARRSPLFRLLLGVRCIMTIKRWEISLWLWLIVNNPEHSFEIGPIVSTSHNHFTVFEW